MIEFTQSIAGVTGYELQRCDAEAGVYHVVLAGGPDAVYHGLRVIPARGGPTTDNATADIVAWLSEPTEIVFVRLADVQAELRALAARRRWEEECKGVTVDGVTFATDDRAKLLLSFAADRARRNAAHMTTWKTANGPVTLSADAVVAAYEAATAHIEACFDREHALQEQITALPNKSAAQALRITIEVFWLA